MFQFFAKKNLTADQKAFWQENGYLILRGALPQREADRMLKIVDDQWRNRDHNDHVVDILSGDKVGNCYALQDTDPVLRSNIYKLNNLFGRLPEVRAICHSPRVKRAVGELMDGDPLICSSLNFERGSQQPFHLDTWYMPPYVDDMMIAANFALEDVDEENGPLNFYPGSHHIPAYRFSNGGLWMIDAEAPACDTYLAAEIERRGLKPVNFTGRKGDVFLWHAQLIHGGSPIKDVGRTRNSLVVHYWRRQDVPTHEVRSDRSGAYLGRSLRGEITF